MKIRQKDLYERVARACEAVRKVTDFVPKVALTLGSGLGDYADQIEVKSEIDYADIPDFPVSTVAGHAGRFVFGTVGNVPLVAMKGRVHFYEGYDIREVVMPVRLLRMLGAEILFLTNAAGGINPDYHAGDLMMIKDHIALFVRNPLIGPNEDRFGTRFPDMSHAYDPALSDIVRKVADKNKIPLREGVYCQLTGPSYETPAEIRMLHALGADAVGMSTVVENICANHVGLKVIGVSCISNMAAGISKVPLTHEEVKETADRTQPVFTRLVTETIKAIG